jgi:predicted ester cyclase
VSDNATIARRWFQEVWVAGGEKVVDLLMAPDAVAWMEGRTVNGPIDFKDARRTLLHTFPDLTVKVEDTIEEGAKVSVRWTATATHRGEGLGVAPTNRRVVFRGITWLEMRDQRVVRGWDSWNLGALIAELQSEPATGSRQE